MDLMLRASHFDCRLCPLAETRRHIVDGAGPTNAPLIIIGEAPGEEEDKYGLPFVGRSGKLLRATLAEHGFPDGTYFLTNIVKCRPPENRDPEQYEIDSCGGWLLSELQQTTGRVILTLGKFAADIIADYESRGFLREGVKIHNAWHPAYIMRAPRFRNAWQEQVQHACDDASGRLRPQAKNISGFPWVRGQPDLDHPYLCIDTETDDLEENIGVRRVAWSISDGRRGRVFLRVPPERVFPESVRGGLQGGSLWPRIWFHNAKYDAPLVGVDLRRLDAWDCSMLAAYVLRYPEVGLKKLSPSLVGMPLRDIHDVLGRGKKRVSFSEALRRAPTLARDYAIEDAVAGSRVAQVVSEQLARSPARLRYYETVEKPAVAVLYDLERRGILVDPDRLVALGEELQRRITRGADIVQRGLGKDNDPQFNRGSSRQLAQALVDKGVKLRFKTPTGQWKMDEAVLQIIARTQPDVRWLVRAELGTRKLEKLQSTYVNPLLQKRDPEGRIHARFNQAVTGTGRLSSNDPNLQNIPIRTELGKRIRRTFIARPGYTFVKGDASQLELRVYAEYTREPFLVDAYTHEDHDRVGRKGGCLRCDVHQRAADMLQVSRDDAKNTLFAAVYGAEEARLAATARVRTEDAHDFLARLRAEIPSLRTWRNRVADDLYRQGYVETMLGWINYYPLFASPIRSEAAAALREAGNMPIQGTGAGIIKVAMTEADTLASQYGAELVETVHDEVGYEVPHANVGVFAGALQTLFRDVGARWLTTIPFVLDVSAGPNWGDCEPIRGT